MSFEVITEDGDARIGVLTTAHGTIETPFFMPVATKGSTKHLSSIELEGLGTHAIISNAFILSLKPGVELIKKFRGIHSFMNFNKVIFTDSGGFQMYSKSFLVRTDPDGIVFKDPFTGKTFLCTPEYNMDLHHAIGSDVAMVLDDMPLYGSSKERIKESVAKTIAWAKRCKERHDTFNSEQLLFGIIQGGVFRDLREFCAKAIVKLDFDGFAFGGLAIGEPQEDTFSALQASLRFVPRDKPRYFMGVGTPHEIVESIGLGIDCFDSRYPTMTARNGTVFTRRGNINIVNAVFRTDKKPIDEVCACSTCKSYTRAYLHHMVRMHESAAPRILSIHNIHFLHTIISEAKEAIRQQRFEEFKNNFLVMYQEEKVFKEQV
jgi:queuine tRNA-ribosyltransferase